MGVFLLSLMIKPGICNEDLSELILILVPIQQNIRTNFLFIEIYLRTFYKCMICHTFLIHFFVLKSPTQ